MISRYLKQVRLWFERVQPGSSDVSSKPKQQAMDPERIDLGENRERRPTHQRGKRNSDRDD
jgi:hypothetical protein